MGGKKNPSQLWEGSSRTLLFLGGGVGEGERCKAAGNRGKVSLSAAFLQQSCRSRPALLRALTTFSSSRQHTLFIFGLPLSPEGLRQSPSAVTDCTSILTCQVAGKFSTMQGPSGRGECATSLPPLVPLRRLFRAREGGGWESGCGRAWPGAKGWLGVLFSLTLAA